MFQYLFKWMENLAGYLILVTAVLQMLPENGYQKYIRFFTGLVLTVLLASPVLHLFGMGDTFQEMLNQSMAREERQMEQKVDKYMEDLKIRTSALELSAEQSQSDLPETEAENGSEMAQRP